MANWLDITFYNFDKQFFIFMNGLQKMAGSFLTPFFKFVSFFGEGGIFLVILSIALMLFAKTRKTGLAMLISILVGALFTNVIIKNIVARIRPFYTSELYKSFWQSAGGVMVREYSFPSGHTTIIMTSMTALFLSTNRRKNWWVYIFVVLMGLSRTYLIVHYLTDVLAGIIVGAIGGTIGYYLGKYIYSLFNKYSYNSFCLFMLNADLKNLIKKNKE